MLQKRINSFRYAFKGLYFFFKTQPHAWLHSLATIVVLVLGYSFKINKIEWLWLIIAIGMVFVAEIFNTAIEELVNLVSPEYNKQAGIVKDVAAAGVLFASFTALIIGLFIFLPKF